MYVLGSSPALTLLRDRSPTFTRSVPSFDAFVYGSWFVLECWWFVYVCLCVYVCACCVSVCETL